MLIAASCSLALGVATLGAADAAPEAHSFERPAPNANVSIIGAKFKPTQLQRKRIRSIKRMIKRAPRGAIVAGANTTNARPISRAPGLGDAWIVPAEDGSICTFIPDAIDGYASSCATEEDLIAGGSITALASMPGSGDGVEAQVVLVVPDQSPNPSILRLDGTSHEIPITGNVGSAIAAPGEKIIAGRVQMTVPELEQPACGQVRPRAASWSCAN